jgi:hypothetical protein
MTEPSKIPPELVREPQARLRRARHRGRPGNRRSELERLLDRSVLEPTHPELGTCWRFTGTTTPYGGPIPVGKELHHRCGVFACSSPDHLEPVTHAREPAARRRSP